MPKEASKYKGVVIVNDRFISKISKDGKNYYLGSYENQEDAAKAYDRMAVHLYGERKRRNFPDTVYTEEEILQEFKNYLERTELSLRPKSKKSVSEILHEILDNQKHMMQSLGITSKERENG